MKNLFIILTIAIFLISCQQQIVPEEEEEQFPATGGGIVTLVDVPEGPYVSGNYYEFTWEAVGGQYISHTNVHTSFSPDFSDRKDSPVLTNGPGVYKGSVKIEGSGTVYIRAYAKIDGEEFHSKTLAVEVISETQKPTITEENNELNGHHEESYEHAHEESHADSEIELKSDYQEVEITAKNWEFIPDTVTVKKGIPVKLKVTSIDVAHGISLSAFGINKRLEPGKETILEFTPDLPGEFTFYCNVYCGSGHTGMKGTLVVEE